uniref:DUF148 domain-containing protein n=1 Tax=Parastrongyloides trichosuri TaxID=131310 RepID=A0A0N4ZXH9_PARTI
MNTKIFIATFLFAGLSIVRMQASDMPQMDGQIGPDGSWGGGGAGGPGGHGGRHGMLPFLQGASDADKQSFMDIMKNKDLTKADAQTQEDAWAASKNSTVQDLYNQFKTNKTAMMTQMKADIKSKTASLSSTAQQIVTDIEAIIDDQSITRAQEHEKIKAILDAASTTDKDALKSIMPMHGMGGHGEDMSGEHTTLSG